MPILGGVPIFQTFIPHPHDSEDYIRMAIDLINCHFGQSCDMVKSITDETMNIIYWFTKCQKMMFNSGTLCPTNQW